MNIYFQNETLYVTIEDLLNEKGITLFRNKLFRILDDYGIDKIVISFHSGYDKKLVDRLKREYYLKYRGYLLIK